MPQAPSSARFMSTRPNCANALKYKISALPLFCFVCAPTQRFRKYDFPVPHGPSSATTSGSSIRSKTSERISPNFRQPKKSLSNPVSYKTTSSLGGRKRIEGTQSKLTALDHSRSRDYAIAITILVNWAVNFCKANRRLVCQ